MHYQPPITTHHPAEERDISHLADQFVLNRKARVKKKVVKRSTEPQLQVRPRVDIFECLFRHARAVCAGMGSVVRAGGGSAGNSVGGIVWEIM